MVSQMLTFADMGGQGKSDMLTYLLVSWEIKIFHYLSHSETTRGLEHGVCGNTEVFNLT